jgi:hypothetical protein
MSFLGREAVRQAIAEFDEAQGQLNTARDLLRKYSTVIQADPRQGEMHWTERGIHRVDTSFGPTTHPAVASPSERELCKHKIREALTNLQDVLRFLEVGDSR